MIDNDRFDRFFLRVKLQTEALNGIEDRTSSAKHGIFSG